MIEELLIGLVKERTATLLLVTHNRSLQAGLTVLTLRERTLVEECEQRGRRSLDKTFSRPDRQQGKQEEDSLPDLALIALSLTALVFALIFVTSMSDAIANKYALINSGHLIVHDRSFPTSSSYDSYRVGTTYGLLYLRRRLLWSFLKVSRIRII